jgi:hypothetical protein
MHMPAVTTVVLSKHLLAQMRAAVMPDDLRDRDRKQEGNDGQACQG